MHATITLIRKAQPMGEYTPTVIDERKAEADFRILAVGSKNTIRWRDGRTEQVTRRQLAKLESQHTWATDF